MNDSVLSREERDLLITLKTKMEGIEKTLQLMDSGLNNRVLNLESNAVSRIELKEVSEETDINTRWRYIFIGAFGLMQIEIPIGIWLISQLWK